jgi:beta-phosphoglucomutase family hydrolase/Cof subfamily protein (haloacid dehalogenase superfamily)
MTRPTRLLLADVDGTLVTQDKILTDRARDAVHRLHEAGILFAITSGRPPRGMSMLIEPLRLGTPVAAFNGGMFVEPDLSVIEQKVIPDDLLAPVISLLTSFDLDVWLYQGTEWFVPDPDGPHVAREAWTVKFAPTVRQGYDGAHDVVKIVGVSDDLDAVARAAEAAHATFGDHVSAARSQPYYLDITHPDANKGQVARFLADRYAVPAAEIATIGDMPNDVLMFAHSGLSIAMGNASTEVQRAARRITTSNEDEGFANAVERYILPARPAPRAATALGLPGRITACLFDLDGVLTSTVDLHKSAWKTTFDAFLREREGPGFTPFSETDYDEHVDGRPRADGVRDFLTSRGIRLPEGRPDDAPTAETVNGVGNRKNELFNSLIEERGITPYPGSVTYLRAVKDAGLAIAVVTSSRNAVAVLRAAGLTDFVRARIDGTVIAERHLRGKPAPDSFLAGAAALGVRPADAAVFEDALAGVAAGRAGGFGCVVGVDRARQAGALHAHGADVVVGDLAELLGRPS